MPEPAFIVEGSLEQAVIQRVCPKHVVRRLGINGRDVSIAAIARRVETHMRLLANRYYPVVIIFDREEREASCAELAAQLSALLDELGYDGQYRIGIPDRNAENWILADWERFSTGIGKPEMARQDAEGLNGKTLIKRFMPDGQPYHETTIGVSLFVSIRPTIAAQASSSFRAFRALIDFRCGWLARA